MAVYHKLDLSQQRHTGIPLHGCQICSWYGQKRHRDCRNPALKLGALLVSMLPWCFLMASIPAMHRQQFMFEFRHDSPFSSLLHVSATGNLQLTVIVVSAGQWIDDFETEHGSHSPWAFGHSTLQWAAGLQSMTLQQSRC